MESLGYVITNKFIIIATDTNIEILEFGINHLEFRLKQDLLNAKKVRDLNKNLAISFVGANWKENQIYDYILNLKNLQNKSFDEMSEDLLDVFGLDTIIEKMVEQENSLIKDFCYSEKIYDKEAIINFIGQDENINLFRKEGLVNFKEGLFTYGHGLNVSTIYLFGVEHKPFKIRTRVYQVQGNSINELIVPEIPENGFFINFSSIIEESNRIKEIEEFEMDNIMPFLVDSWEEDNRATDKLIIEAKQALKNGIEKITPHKVLIPEIVFCELSKNTNYEFKQPDNLCEYKIK